MASPVEEEESRVGIREGGQKGRESKVGMGREEVGEGVFPAGIGMAGMEDLGDGVGEEAGVAGGRGPGRGAEARLYAW
jgi:hypothetical protein